MIFDHDLWGWIVSDGPDFCHWGGKRQSLQLAELLRAEKKDRVLELCCGCGGLLQMIDQPTFVCGIDISSRALGKAAGSQKSNARFVLGSVLNLPFADQSFTKLVSQDGDVWMFPQKESLMREIARVTACGGRFVWQNYAVTSALTKSAKKITSERLSNCGYDSTDLPRTEDLMQVFGEAGFRILELRSLHELYAADNRRMIKRFRGVKQELLQRFSQTSVEAVGKLLEWEEVLFSEKAWTGVLIIAQKT